MRTNPITVLLDSGKCQLPYADSAKLHLHKYLNIGKIQTVASVDVAKAIVDFLVDFLDFGHSLERIKDGLSFHCEKEGKTLLIKPSGWSKRVQDHVIHEPVFTDDKEDLRYAYRTFHAHKTCFKEDFHKLVNQIVSGEVSPDDYIGDNYDELDTDDDIIEALGYVIKRVDPALYQSTETPVGARYAIFTRNEPVFYWDGRHCPG